MEISRHAFERLIQTPLSVSEALRGEDIRIAQTVSWAVWASREGATDTSWSRDTSILDYDNLAPTIHADAVLIALNDGGAERASSLPAWHMFHSGRRDFMLAEALEDTWLWGAFMTDFYKGMPTETGADLERYLDQLGGAKRDEIERVMADQIELELAILGVRDPLLIALGGAAARVVKERLGARYRVEQLTHYSSQQLSKADYRAEVARLVDRHPAPSVGQTEVVNT